MLLTNVHGLDLAKSLFVVVFFNIMTFANIYGLTRFLAHFTVVVQLPVKIIRLFSELRAELSHQILATLLITLQFPFSFHCWQIVLRSVLILLNRPRILGYRVNRL